MNPYPGDRSILVLDNCAIHKSQSLREVVEAHGMASNWYASAACLLTTLHRLFHAFPPRILAGSQSN